MAIYDIGVRSAAVAATGGGIFADLGGNTNDRARLRELGLFFAAGVAPVLGIGRPANTPVGGTAALDLATDPADPTPSAGNNTNAYTAGWSTAPTVPGSFLRRLALPATVGAGVILPFWPPHPGIVIGAARNLDLLIWCIALASATSTQIDIYASIEE